MCRTEKRSNVVYILADQKSLSIFSHTVLRKAKAWTRSSFSYNAGALKITLKKVIILPTPLTCTKSFQWWCFPNLCSLVFTIYHFILTGLGTSGGSRTKGHSSSFRHQTRVRPGLHWQASSLFSLSKLNICQTIEYPSFQRWIQAALENYSNKKTWGVKTSIKTKLLLPLTTANGTTLPRELCSTQWKRFTIKQSASSKFQMHHKRKISGADLTVHIT